MIEEKWRFVPGTYFQVSNLGNMRKQLKSGKFKDLKGSTDGDGYLQVNMTIDGKVTRRRVHRLVAEAFIKEIPPSYHIHHRDENPSNNCVDNLVILSAKEHKAQHKHDPKHKLTMEQAREIRRLYFVDGLSMAAICKLFPDFSRPAINRVKGCIDGYYEDFDDPIYCAVYYADDEDTVNTYEPRIMRWRHPLEYKKWKESLKKIA